MLKQLAAKSPYFQVNIPEENMFIGFDPLEITQLLHYDKEAMIAHNQNDKEPKEFGQYQSIFQKAATSATHEISEPGMDE